MEVKGGGSLMEINKFEERINEVKRAMREIKKLASILKAKKVEVRTSFLFSDANFFIVLGCKDKVFQEGIVIKIDFEDRKMVFKAHGLRFSYYNVFSYNPKNIVTIGEKYAKKFENDDGEKIKVVQC